MRRRVPCALLVALLAALAAAGASAHGGKSHQLLGTVKAVHVVVTTADGHERTVRLTPGTKYEKGGKPVPPAGLAAGTRVSISLTEDDRTALKVKIGQAPAAR